MTINVTLPSGSVFLCCANKVSISRFPSLRVRFTSADNLHTPAAQIGFSFQLKCVLLYTFYEEIMIPEYVEKRKRIFPLLMTPRNPFYLVVYTEEMNDGHSVAGGAALHLILPELN